MVEVAALQVSRLVGRGKLFCGKFADRLEHPEPRATGPAAAPEQALVEQRLQRVGLCACDVFGGVEAAAASEDAQTTY